MSPLVLYLMKIFIGACLLLSVNSRVDQRRLKDLDFCVSVGVNIGVAFSIRNQCRQLVLYRLKLIFCIFNERFAVFLNDLRISNNFFLLDYPFVLFVFDVVSLDCECG